MKISAVIVAIILTACSIHHKPDSAPSMCVDYNQTNRYAELWGMDSRYKVDLSRTTNNGIRIDVSHNTIDLDKVEQLVDRIDRCMYDQFGKDGKLSIPAEVSRPAYCQTRTPRIPIPRECISIKVPDLNDGWHTSCDGTGQLLDWLAPAETCEAKGQTLTDECRCYWRSGVQDGHTVVTTPDFLLFADWYVRVFYGCLNPWGHPSMAKCVNQGKL